MTGFSRSWVPATLVAGILYALVGIGFALPTTHSHAWRLAAWGVSALVFGAHIAHERFRLRSPPRWAAVHVSSAAALGAFGMAVGANVNGIIRGSSGDQRSLLLLALAIWPLITAVPAFVVALATSSVLARFFRWTPAWGLALPWRVVRHLTAQRYQPDATLKSWFMPYCGIYWGDELPEFDVMFALSEEERFSIFRLLALRIKIWRGQSFSPHEEVFWNQARQQAPGAALFQRLEVSEDYLRAQEACERDLMEGFRELADRADQLEFTEGEDGTVRFEATIRLTDDDSSRGRGTPS